MRRLPIRLRLTAVFALAMAVVLAATGLFLFVRLGTAFDATINSGLQSRADELATLVDQSQVSLAGATEPATGEVEDGFSQVLRSDGTVLRSTAPLGREPLLTSAELERAALAPTFFDRKQLPGSDDPARLLAVLADPGRRLVLVVGTSTEARAEALANLFGELLIAAPIALVLASLLAYALATAALRPVESMRSRAAAIRASTPGERLPVPKTNDEIARLGKTLNDMLARLEAALERERTFVADASHELRTPLALLKSELELARRRPRTREELEAALRSAAEETDRLARLAEDLLVLARADDDGLPLRRAPVSVRDVAERVRARFARDAAEHGRTIEVEAPAGLLVLADRERVEQALANLVDNALRHGRGPVRIVAEAHNGTVELHVLDEGAGFPDGFAERAFERFARADEARATGGAGLGLAIAQVVGRAHGGTSGARNRVDAPGADVWLVLPAGPA